MSHVGDFELEHLPGVESHLISKLRRAGIESVLHLAYQFRMSLRMEIMKVTQLQLVMKARNALIDSGVLSKEFCTAEEVLARRNTLVRFTTGSKNLASFLKGGIETQAITEFAGEFGSGKSQICHTLCVTANNMNTAEGNIIFIDTENTFRPERIHQIAEGRGLETEEIMKRIFVCKINNSAHLEAILKNLGKSIAITDNTI